MEQHPLYAINALADSGAQFRLLAFWRLREQPGQQDAGIVELETIQVRQGGAATPVNFEPSSPAPLPLAGGVPPAGVPLSGALPAIRPPVTAEGGGAAAAGVEPPEAPSGLARLGRMFARAD